MLSNINCFFFNDSKVLGWNEIPAVLCVATPCRGCLASLELFGVEKVGWSLMDVSENNGTPTSSILIGFSIINHPFWGTTIFGNTLMIHFVPHKNPILFHVNILWFNFFRPQLVRPATPLPQGTGVEAWSFSTLETCCVIRFCWFQLGYQVMPAQGILCWICGSWQWRCRDRRGLMWDQKNNIVSLWWYTF